MGINRIYFENFTAFRELELQCSPGINIFIGPNGTGKTHILKAAYSACDITKTGDHLAQKLVNVFRPSGNQLGRLVFRKQGCHKATFVMERNNGQSKIDFTFSSRVKKNESSTISGFELWNETKVESVYLPVKEMLANAPGFLSLYNARELHFEEVYVDLLHRAYLPPLRGEVGKEKKKLLSVLETIMEGRVITDNEEFFLQGKHGNLEFSLLAEGIRKLALLWQLIQNGTLLRGSILFMDEPEANLNPKMMRTLVEILLELQRSGVQIFIATHDYVTLKEFDLQASREDGVRYHALYRNDTGDIQLKSCESYLDIAPNAVADTFADLYDRDLERALR